jgi:amino acid adenylation domain-containing protein
VGVCLERSVELVVGLLGILKAGGAYLPLEPSNPTERLASMLGQARAPVVITTAALRPHLPVVGVRIVDVGADDAATWPDGPPAVDVHPDNLAYVLFTSGSTGAPKGAMNAHRGIVNRLFWMQEAYGLDATDRVLQKTPFGFDVSVWEFFWPLVQGATLVVARPGGHLDAGYLADLIAREGVTTLHFVPSMLQVFLEEDDLGRCAGLRRVILSGEALSPALRQRFFERLDVPLHNLYGPTECAVDVTAWPCARDEGAAPVPIGRPVTNTAIYVLDDAGCAVPVGVPGELFIGGVQVGRGYAHRPGLTAERFVPSPFGDPGSRLYRTGDLARFRPDGAIEFLGRRDHQVKLHGVRIELGEIEAALGGCAGVREAVVTAHAERGGDPRLVAYVAPEPDASLDPTALRAILQARLPGPMVPSVFVVLDRLPLNPNGKVDRRALPAPDGPASQLAPRVPPRTDAERTIAAALETVLGVPQVGIHESFFELGATSFDVLRLHQQLKRRFPIAVVDLFTYPTVAALAAHFASAEPAETAAPTVAGARQRAARQRRALARRSAPVNAPPTAASLRAAGREPDDG